MQLWRPAGRVADLFGSLGGSAHDMKAISSISGLFALAMVVASVGCKRRSSSTPLPPGAVVFQGAGVALLPGEHWKLHSEPFPKHGDICPPLLEGKGELDGIVLQVRSSATDRSLPETGATSIRKQLDGNPEVVIGDSFKQEPFVTDSGLAGVHVSYDAEEEKKQGKVKSRVHVYFVQNAEGCIVKVLVREIAPHDPEPVHQMIRKTLRLK